MGLAFKELRHTPTVYFLMGAIWIRRTGKDAWRIGQKVEDLKGCRLTTEEAKNVNANDDIYTMAVAA
jgi:hypothetical protein